MEYNFRFLVMSPNKCTWQQLVIKCVAKEKKITNHFLTSASINTQTSYLLIKKNYDPNPLNKPTFIT